MAVVRAPRQLEPAMQYHRYRQIWWEESMKQTYDNIISLEIEKTSIIVFVQKSYEPLYDLSLLFIITKLDPWKLILLLKSKEN